MGWKRSAALVFALVSSAAVFGCGTATENGTELRVVATTTQVADLVRAVGGDEIELTQILPANADPHEYEVLPSDAKAVAQADVVFSSGGDVDRWLDDILKNSGSDVVQTTMIRKVKTLEAGNGEGVDPHWWQDPRNGVLAIDEIEKRLTAVRPQKATQFRRNAAKYKARLVALDVAIHRCLAAIPPRKRKLVTNHDALGYFAKRYGITLIGTAIPSLSTQAQPSAGATKDLVDRIRSEHVSAIFPESSLNKKLEEAIANEAGVKIGRPLWADALGPKGSDGSTYLNSLRSNTRALVEGFTDVKSSCKLPA